MASTAALIKATIYSIIAFVIVSLPFTYKLTNDLLGRFMGKLADPSGCATSLGLAVHSIVFGVIIYVLMIIVPV